MIGKIHFYHGCILALFSVVFLLLPQGVPATAAAAESERIAVLPFKIHMERPMDHLVEGMQAMAIARLAKEGFDLIDPEVLKKTELYRIPLSDLDRIREEGRGNDIDWVVQGTLTQIGENVSLDFTIVPTATEKRPSTVFVTGDSIDNLAEIIDSVAVRVTSRIRGIALIVSLAVSGNKRVESDAILAVVESREGTRFDPEALNRDLRSVYEMGFLEDVQIEAEDVPGGKKVTFKVSEKQSIGKILFKGNKKIEQKDLKKVVGIKEYSILNRRDIKDSIERLRDYYHGEGFYNVEIRERVEELPNNEVALTYDIDEGEKVYIRKIQFKGNVTVDSDDIKDVMDTSEKGFFSFITHSGQLDRKKLESDVTKIKSFYYNNGFVKAQVGEPDISYQKDEGLIITITINEGPQYTVGNVSVAGDLIKEAEELYGALKITEEKVYNREVIRSDVMTLSEIYADEGYAFADISPKIKEDDEKHTVDITYQISKGKKVRFERIEIAGNDRTRDKVIRRELKVVEGGYFSGKDMRRGVQNLYRLGFFEDVEVNTKRGSSDEEMILDIGIKEAPTGMFSLGVGYSSVEKTIGMMEIAKDNLFGRGQSLSAKASLSTVSTKYNISFTEPWLFDKPLSAGIDLYNWEYEYDEYTKDSSGGRLKLGFPLGPEFTTGTVAYTYDDSEISDIEDTAAQVIKDMEGTNVTSSLTFGVTRDSRDRYFNATSGSINSLSIEYAGGFLGGDNYFTKYTARTAWFFPFIGDTAFSVQGRWGFVEQRSGGELPVYEKFTIGGMNTVRGFDYGAISPLDPETGDRIGGEKMMVYNLEFRFPLQKEQGVWGVLFFDAGNVFTEDEEWTFKGIRMGAGAGVRWITAIAPLRLEWGYNLNRRPGEDASNWEFTLGTPF
ncbi:MAG TPA: outer membrane protein assembly factor BamA [Desulfatiglandales bacterium]|nr:outer membrane protein assembly factor BamA [Desulfatiglandales bacterium]